MQLDATGQIVAAGLMVAVLYSALRAWKHQDFDVGGAIGTFLAGTGLIAAAQISAVAVSGDVKALPGHWREYLAIAGVAGFGMAGREILERMKSALKRKQALDRDAP